MLSKTDGEGVKIVLMNPLARVPEGAGVALRVTNGWQLEASFGGQLAKATMRRVRLALDQQLSVTCVDDSEFGMFSFFLPADQFSILGLRSGNIEGGLSQSLSAILVSMFLHDDSGAVLPVVQVSAAVAGESAPLGSTRNDVLALACRSIRMSVLGDKARASDIESLSQYREKTLRASNYLTDLLSPETREFGVPIARAKDQMALYHSMSVYTASADDGNRALTEGYDDVVSIGLVRNVDEMRVMRAIRMLIADPLLCLGVQIAGVSAVLDHCWSSIMAELANDRSVAARLFVEIQPPFGVFGRASSLEFFKEIRALGVVIVLDRFGAGESSFRDILALQPDYVKLEASFLWRARANSESFETLRHLVGLAHSLMAPAIVAGVNSDALAKTAVDAGGVWQCGDFIGTPYKLTVCKRDFNVKIGDDYA